MDAICEGRTRDILPTKGGLAFASLMASSRGMYTKPARLGATHVALCIGNSKYASSPLQNAANDAQDMAALCTNLGFATELVLDATLDEMLDTVAAFSGKLSRGGISLFFYAGE
jgi:Caspase domain